MKKVRRKGRNPDPRKSRTKTKVKIIRSKGPIPNQKLTQNQLSGIQIPSFRFQGARKSRRKVKTETETVRSKIRRKVKRETEMVPSKNRRKVETESETVRSKI